MVFGLRFAARRCRANEAISRSSRRAVPCAAPVRGLTIGDNPQLAYKDFQNIYRL